MEKVNTVKKQLAGLSTRCALLFLVQNGAGGKMFFWGGQMWTPTQAAAEWDGYLLQMSSESFGVVRFFGGPPGKATWYDGSLLSMVCDLVLFNENTKSLSLSERLSA